MQFRLMPILDKMKQFYQLPITKERFDKYLFMLQGKDKKDMILPIAGYNPMGKEQVLLKIKALQALKAEVVAEKIISEINPTISNNDDKIFTIVINVADDIGGAWSNRYTTDYTNKFEIKALVKRNFCTPYFWTSENYTTSLIEQRIKEAIYRTIYFINTTFTNTLEDHVKQEIFVQQNSGISRFIEKQENFVKIEGFYLKNLNSENYNLIFNFLYGDEASSKLAFTPYGIKKDEGFEYINYLSNTNS